MLLYLYSSLNSKSGVNFSWASGTILGNRSGQMLEIVETNYLTIAYYWNQNMASETDAW
jgi:hypothetical protein